ncbi:FecR family protein [Hymenobacter glacialis]|uniref:Uncharacterized protein n=1 Tax=Hymenobacter glacialis TaxID=1908236 RepID=A0A1G1T3H6_9BACT|nr:FecR domain-containing protein [Hymenobacter glacialis]OGX85427.1 hypothetical protein BEN48_14305 [Hymenobacter glacialis]
MKQSYFSELLKRYLHDDCTEGEAWTVDQWYEARDMPRPADRPTPAEEAVAKAKMWQQVQYRTQPRPTRWHTPALRWAAAAVVALGLGVAGLGTWQPTAGTRPASGREAAVQVSTAQGWVTCTNATGRPAQVLLADGSTVVLQSGSCLRYPRRFAEPERRVELSGEAFFEVAHDATHPFRVLTKQLETMVLGTSFTVRAFPGQAEAAVMVRTGRVHVVPNAVADTQQPSRPPAGVLLLPNQQAVYSAAVRELRRELVAQPAVLQPQALAFTERPVTEVLASLQTAYGVPILYNGAALASCTVSLAFGQEESLDGKLTLLCKTLGATYERASEKIIFRSRGCQSE